MPSFSRSLLERYPALPSNIALASSIASCYIYCTSNIAAVVSSIIIVVPSYSELPLHVALALERSIIPLAATMSAHDIEKLIDYEDKHGVVTNVAPAMASA